MKSHASKPALPEVPAFTSDRLRMLAPLISPRAVELALARILRPKDRLVEEGGGTGKEDPAVVKVALILIDFLNPGEALTNEEEGLRCGLSGKTVGKRKAAGEF